MNIKQTFEKITNKPKLKKFLVMACFAIIHEIFWLAFGLSKYTVEGTEISAGILVPSAIMLSLEIAFVIFSRIKRYKNHLKGLFLFKFIGIIFFVMAWAGMLLNGEGTASNWISLFEWFAIPTYPIAVLLSPFMHVSRFYREGVVFALMTYICGQMLTKIKKVEAFEQKVKESREMQEESERRKNLRGKAE